MPATIEQLTLLRGKPTSSTLSHRSDLMGRAPSSIPVTAFFAAPALTPNRTAPAAMMVQQAKFPVVPLASIEYDEATLESRPDEFMLFQEADKRPGAPDSNHAGQEGTAVPELHLTHLAGEDCIPATERGCAPGKMYKGALGHGEPCMSQPDIRKLTGNDQTCGSSDLLGEGMQASCLEAVTSLTIPQTLSDQVLADDEFQSLPESIWQVAPDGQLLPQCQQVDACVMALLLLLVGIVAIISLRQQWQLQ